MRNIIINTIFVVAAVVAVLIPVAVYLLEGSVETGLIIKSVAVVASLVIAIKRPGKVIRKPTIDELREHCPELAGSSFETDKQERLIRDAYYYLSIDDPSKALARLRTLMPLCERAAEMGAVHNLMADCYLELDDEEGRRKHSEKAKLYRPDLFAEN